MNKDKEQRVIKAIASKIYRQLSFTNGWSIPEDRYHEHCEKAAAKILRYFKRVNKRK